jgi:hypothetical protein
MRLIGEHRQYVGDAHARGRGGMGRVECGGRTGLIGPLSDTTYTVSGLVRS